VKSLRLLGFVTLALLAGSCAANDTAKLEDDVEMLKRRVQALEAKVKRLEGGGKKGGSKAAKAKGKGKSKGKDAKGKGKAPKGKDAKGKSAKGKDAKGKDAKGKTAKGKDAKSKTKTASIAPGKGALTLTGDAIKVMVDNGQRKYVVPNTRLAPGDYTLMAAFGGETTLTAYGQVTVEKGKSIPVTCTAEPKGCTLGAAVTP